MKLCFGYVLDTHPAPQDNFGYALNRSNFGYAGSKVREGCTKRNFGYVMDTRTSLQHIQKFWIRILGLGCPGTHHNESKANIGLLRTPRDPCRRSMEVYGSPGDFPGDPGDSRKSLQWALAQSRYSGSDSTNNLKPHCIDFDPGCTSQVRMGLGSKSIKWGLRLALVSDPTVLTFGQF